MHDPSSSKGSVSGFLPAEDCHCLCVHAIVCTIIVMHFIHSLKSLGAILSSGVYSVCTEVKECHAAMNLRTHQESTSLMVAGVYHPLGVVTCIKG